ACGAEFEHAGHRRCRRRLRALLGRPAGGDGLPEDRRGQLHAAVDRRDRRGQDPPRPVPGAATPRWQRRLHLRPPPPRPPPPPHPPPRPPPPTAPPPPSAPRMPPAAAPCSSVSTSAARSAPAGRSRSRQRRRKRAPSAAPPPELVQCRFQQGQRGQIFGTRRS